jgi:hypothetical protein
MANVKKGVAIYNQKKNNTSTNTSSSKTSSSNNTSTKKTSNVSYNGSFVTYDNDVDYAAKINEAVKAGDYAAASMYEAQRNAKLIGLGRGDEVTTDYIQVYSKSPTNNQGGPIYESKYGSVSDAPSGWTTVALNTGGTYRNDGDSISRRTGTGANAWTTVGNAVNPSTGEFSWNNPQQASDYAYNQYIASGGNKNVSKDYALQNLIDKDYIDAVNRGEVASYTQLLMDKAQAARDRILAEEAKASLSKRARNYGDKSNSFEAESESKSETPDSSSLYRDRLIQLLSGSRRYVY